MENVENENPGVEPAAKPAANPGAKLSAKDLVGTSLRIVGKAWRPLLLFEVSYKLIAVFLILPVCSLAFSLALELSPAAYVSLFNIPEILASPLLVITLVLLALLAGVCVFYEISALIIMFREALEGKDVSTVYVAKEALAQSLRILKPRNWGLLAYTMLLIPLSGFVFSSNFVGGFRVPIFVAAELHPPLLYAYWAFMAVDVVAVVLFMFAFHNFVLRGEDGVAVFKGSLRQVKGNLLRIAAGYIGTRVVLYAAFGVLLALLIGITFATTFLAWGIDVGSAALYSQMSMWGTFCQAVLRIALLITTFSVLSVAYVRIHEGMGNAAERGMGNASELVELRRFPSVDYSRKRSKLVLVPLCLLLFLGLNLVNSSLSIASYLGYGPSNASDVQVIAHRGNAVSAPENTIPAIESAIDAKADYAEIDVQLTSDGVVVLTHDSNLKRMTGVDANVSELTFDEVEKLDASGTFTKYKGTKIPSLEQVIDACGDDIKLLIELKPVAGTEDALVKGVVELLNEKDFVGKCAVQSLDYDLLVAVKEADSSIYCAYCAPFIQGNWENLEAADFLTVEQTYVGAWQVSRAASFGKDIWTWTVDDASDVIRVSNTGKAMNGIITNDPTMVRQTVELDREADEIMNELVVKAAKSMGMQSKGFLTDAASTLLR